MTTHLLLWFELVVTWTDPGVSVSAGPVVVATHSANVYSLTPIEDTLQIEPANLTYHVLDAETEIESRINAYITAAR